MRLQQLTWIQSTHSQKEATFSQPALYSQKGLIPHISSSTYSYTTQEASSSYIIQLQLPCARHSRYWAFSLVAHCEVRGHRRILTSNSHLLYFNQLYKEAELEERDKLGVDQAIYVFTALQAGEDPNVLLTHVVVTYDVRPSASNVPPCMANCMVCDGACMCVCLQLCRWQRWSC